MDLKLQFHNDMKKIYIEAGKLGYPAHKFIQKVSEIGGFEAARSFIVKSGGTEGFLKLYELKRLDLSVENLVLQPEYQELFSEQELEICRKRLEDFGYELNVKIAAKNPSWTKDELILALDLYFKVNPSHVNASNDKIVELSNV